MDSLFLLGGADGSDERPMAAFQEQRRQTAAIFLAPNVHHDLPASGSRRCDERVNEENSFSASAAVRATPRALGDRVEHDSRSVQHPPAHVSGRRT